MKKIYTILINKYNNLSNCIDYILKALDLQIIEELHIWNNDFSNSNYIEIYKNLLNCPNAYNLKAIISNNQIYNLVITDNPCIIKLNYKIDDELKNYEIIFNTEIINDNKLQFLKRNNKLIKVTNNYKTQYNYIFKNNEKIICISTDKNILIHKNNLKIEILEKIIMVYLNDTILFIVENNHKILDVTVNQLNQKIYQLTKNILLFNVSKDKFIKEYYEHYSNETYNNDIIIKSNDSICFLDLFNFKNYINYVQNSKGLLIFPNIINHDYCGFIQQKFLKLIPNTINLSHYRKNSNDRMKTIPESKSMLIHNYFIDNLDNFINKNFKLENNKLFCYFETIFFACLGKNWHIIKNCYNDESSELTEKLIIKSGGKLYNELYPSFFISTLTQSSKINVDLIDSYKNIFKLKYYD